MEFEWDEEKADRNKQKHGIRFEDAVKAFDDPNGLELLDRATAEIRFQLIALSNDTVLLVVFTERINTIRIISARKANKRENDIYYERED